jgi:hypothetical protein
LIGTGIACGLSFTWTPTGAGDVNAIVEIRDGCAITSAGYLVVYKQVQLTHKRRFKRLKDYPPFNDLGMTENDIVYELITQADYNAEEEDAKDVLKNADKANMVLIIFLEPQLKHPPKCLDEGCDDTGKMYVYEPRPLLVPIRFINLLLEANNKPYATEAGKGWKGIDKRINDFDVAFLGTKNLFARTDIRTVNTSPALRQLFASAMTNADFTQMENRMNTSLQAFTWMFKDTLADLKSEYPAINADTPNIGSLFVSKAKAARDDQQLPIQYVYDFVRDVVDCYNDLLNNVYDLTSECAGNEFQNPFHVMLGLPLTPGSNDAIPPYREEKYLSPAAREFRYRNTFIPSPIMGSQHLLFEKVQQLIRRLTRVIRTFSINPQDTEIKVIPSEDYSNLIGYRAIPYYYSDANLLKKSWNYGSTRRNALGGRKGYHLSSQASQLEYDVAKNDFLRIEGHIGQNYDQVLKGINDIRERYNLPFSVIDVSVEPRAANNTSNDCGYADLEADFAYYRDRVLWYLDEIEAYIQKAALVKKYFGSIQESIIRMRKLLMVSCFKDFDYLYYTNELKDIYAEFTKTLVTLLAAKIYSVPVQLLNELFSLLNYFVVRPIYKIYYQYKYRKGLGSHSNSIESLDELLKHHTGLEHLAGVRRGETFVLVHERASGNVIADFNLAGEVCDCNGCQPGECSGNERSIVEPFARPLIMVVDYRKDQTTTTGKAVPVDDKRSAYVLTFTGKSFYKGDSKIESRFKIYDDLDKDGPKDSLTGTYGDETGREILTLEYKSKKMPKSLVPQWLTYRLRGDFGEVTGHILLIVIPQEEILTHIPKDIASPPIRVYDKDDFLKYQKVELEFENPEIKNYGDLKNVPVYVSPLGNEVAILRDETNTQYLKVMKAAKAGTEKINYTMMVDGVPYESSITINVVDAEDKHEPEILKGKVLLDNGKPAINAAVKLGEQVVFTDDEGNYKLTGAKSGDIVEVEMAGMKKTAVQVNSTMNTELKLDQDALAGISEMKLPTSLSELTSGTNMAKLKGIITKR